MANIVTPSRTQLPYLTPRQTLTPVKGDVAKLAGTPGRRLVLGERPVVAVHGIKIDGRVVPDYRARRDGTCWREAGWGDDASTVTVTYDHGYDPLPDDLVAVCRNAAARFADNPAALRSYSIGGEWSQTYAEPILGFTITELAVLDQYRRRAWP